MPMARKVWQLASPSPTAVTRRLIIRNTSARLIWRTLSLLARGIERHRGVFFSAAIPAAARQASSEASALWWTGTAWCLPPENVQGVVVVQRVGIHGRGRLSSLWPEDGVGMRGDDLQRSLLGEVRVHRVPHDPRQRDLLGPSNPFERPVHVR